MNQLLYNDLQQITDGIAYKVKYNFLTDEESFDENKNIRQTVFVQFQSCQYIPIYNIVTPKFAMRISSDFLHKYSTICLTF